jgi:hypothetical protein
MLIHNLHQHASIVAENTNTTKQNAPLFGRSVGNVENPINLKACANQVTREDHVSKTSKPEAEGVSSVLILFLDSSAALQISRHFWRSKSATLNNLSLKFESLIPQINLSLISESCSAP